MATQIDSSGPATFSEAKYASGQGAEQLAIADVNGDGHPDLIVPDIYANSVSILLGTGSSFGSPNTFSVGIHPNTVVAGDLNGDGHVDFLVNPGDNSPVLKVYLGDGSGAFVEMPGAATAFNGEFALGD